MLCSFLGLFCFYVINIHCDAVGLRSGLKRSLRKALRRRNPHLLQSHISFRSQLFFLIYPEILLRSTQKGLTNFRFRAACQNAILQDFESARSIDVEGRLWDAHLKINTRFRKLLARVSAGQIEGVFSRASSDLNNPLGSR